MPPPNVYIETTRLIIKRTCKEDADFCLEIWLDDEMGKYLLDQPREKAEATYLEWKKDVETFNGNYAFIAISKKTGEYIGTGSAVPDVNNKTWDIGYAVHKKYWRQGYATEIIRGLIDFCQDNGAEIISASVARENLASIALLNKLSFSIGKKDVFKMCGTDIVFDEYIYGAK